MKHDSAAIRQRDHRLKSKLRGFADIGKVSVSTDRDPYIWLEDHDSPRTQEWVRRRNAETLKELQDNQFVQDQRVALRILEAPTRVPNVRLHGSSGYNFWQDEKNPKGVWRRTTPSSYLAGRPDWETLLDLDVLSHADEIDYVWRSATLSHDAYDRCLVLLSCGGGDAVVVKEFDLKAKKFCDDGFVLPNAKSEVCWVDRDTVLVASPIGGNEYCTDSGYARTVRQWRRGVALTNAEIIFECSVTDLAASVKYEHHPDSPAVLFNRQIDFFRNEFFVEQSEGKRCKMEVPEKSSVRLIGGRIFVALQSSWSVGDRSYPSGSLLALESQKYFRGQRDIAVLFEPTENTFLIDFAISGEQVAMHVTDDVRSRVVLCRPDQESWRFETLSELPELGTIKIDAFCHDHTCWYTEVYQNTFVVHAETSITPAFGRLVECDRPSKDLYKATPAFNSSGLQQQQHFAVSPDGTRVPYVQVGGEAYCRDGDIPTLMFGYGGFNISKFPTYAAVLGKLWLERGGTYVLANIRGGGEYGPQWHEKGTRAGKRRSHDDFAAVAEDLIRRKITKPSRLACTGTSNGGLLVGNMFTRYQHLFGAIICASPLLDMRRYTKLLAGRSCVAEYGDPDNADDWKFLQDISAYHNVDLDRETNYPPILLTTLTQDDRVHPAHARKMMALLLELGKVAHFYEHPTGGHISGTDNARSAFTAALTYTFLRKTIAPEFGEVTI